MPTLLNFFSKDIPFPKTTSEDYLLQSASDILTILKSPPTSLPYLQYGDSTKNALVKLSHLIKSAVEHPRLQSEHTPAISTPPIVTTLSIVVPPPLSPLPRVETSTSHRNPTSSQLQNGMDTPKCPTHDLHHEQ